MKSTGEDRMTLLREVKGRTTTHSCPSCGKGTYCAMLDGKSGSACWCMGEAASEAVFLPVPDPEENAECLCKECLTRK